MNSGHLNPPTIIYNPTMPGDWAFWLAGLALALGGAALLTFALLGDWFKHQGTLRRCPKCWYDLFGTPSLKCPECGRTFRREKKLHKSRRRWKWVFASALIFGLAGVAAIQPKVRRDGWLSVMPTDVMILALRLPDDDPAFVELERRTQNDIALVNPYAPFTGVNVFDPTTLRERHYRSIGDACVEKLGTAQTSNRKLLLLQWLSTISIVMDPPESLKYFQPIVTAMDDADPKVRHDAAMYCANGRYPAESVKAIRPLLDDSSPRVRIAAVTGLRLVGSHNSAPSETLIECLNHEDSSVREHAAGALGAMARHGFATDDTFAAIHATFNKDTDMKVQTRALRSMSLFENRIDEVIAALRDVADHPSAAMREEVLWTVSSMEQFDPEFETRIAVAAIQDDAVAVREAADWLLFNRISPEHLQPHRELFESLAFSDDPYLKRVGAVVLERIQTGQ